MSIISWSLSCWTERTHLTVEAVDVERIGDVSLDDTALEERSDAPYIVEDSFIKQQLVQSQDNNNQNVNL